MATKLAGIDIGLELQCIAIFTVVILPSILNILLWRCMNQNKHTKRISGIYEFALLGPPSPFFLYLWQLYLSIVKESDQSFRMLCSCFRMVHGYICSLPLMLINLYTL